VWRVQHEPIQPITVKLQASIQRINAEIAKLR